jgi:hypothetical protein
MGNICQAKFSYWRIFMDIKQRLKYVVETVSGGKHTVFAKKCGIPPGSFQAYINGQRIPPTEHLIKILTVCGINLNWLLIGEGEPFIGEEVLGGEATKLDQNDPVLQLLNDEEQRAGISLTPEQHTVILKIFRDLVERDIRTIRELLRSIPGKQAT